MDAFLHPKPPTEHEFVLALLICQHTVPNSEQTAEDPCYTTLKHFSRESLQKVCLGTAVQLRGCV